MLFSEVKLPDKRIITLCFLICFKNFFQKSYAKATSNAWIYQSRVFISTALKKKKKLATE